VKTGTVKTLFAEMEMMAEFLESMVKIALVCPEEREIRVILGGCCIRKKHDESLASRHNVHFDYPPASAIRMNMAEIWFGMLPRRLLEAKASKAWRGWRGNKGVLRGIQFRCRTIYLAQAGSEG
jgi:hypothetical protein